MTWVQHDVINVCTCWVMLVQVLLRAHTVNGILQHQTRPDRVLCLVDVSGSIMLLFYLKKPRCNRSAGSIFHLTK